MKSAYRSRDFSPITRPMTSAQPPAQKTIEDLLEIMAALRTPVTGCPWDLEQSFATIAPYTIEEAYEVADAIERGDTCHLKEELGDLLLQVVYHARMAEEEGSFAFADVVDAICQKMVRRHPHVFGDEKVRASVELKGLWERIKAQEKSERSSGDDAAASILDAVPVTLPALSRAVKLQDKAAKAGFDWPEVIPVIEKVREELRELENEIGGEDSDFAKVGEEYGDLLFALANLARHLKLDPETAMRSANAKFARRFQRVESLLAETGRKPDDASLAEMDAAWEQAKDEEGKGRS